MVVSVLFLKNICLFGCIRSLLHHLGSFVVLHGLSSCGPQSQWLWHMPLGTLQHVES